MLSSESNPKAATPSGWAAYFEAVAKRDAELAKAKLVSPERIAELTAMGYSIEDMGAIYGADWEGQYRWVNANGEWQGEELVYGVNGAWVLADQCARHLNSRNTAQGNDP